MLTTTVVIGSGVLGTHFARLWRQRHPAAPLVCTVRHAGGRERVDVADTRIALVDLLRPEGLDRLLRGAGQVLASVAPGPGAGDELWSVGLANLVQALDPRADAHLVHISSTGVYAAVDGSEVDECAATAAQAEALLAAEAAALGAGRATVLRCSGLVGPGRGPQRVVARLAGTARADGAAWLNLVWMDDVVEVIARAFERRIVGTFNLSGPPLRRRDFYDPVLARAGLAPIRWQPPQGPAGRKIVSERLVEAFGLRPRAVRAEDLET